jgi:hypothetical protein
MSMFSEAQVEEDVQWLLDTVEQIGHAKGQVIYREQMLKHIRALEMQRCGENSAAAQIREAEASETYKRAILDLAVAVKNHEVLHAERKSREMRCEIFRTIRADQRQFTRAIR